MSSIRRSHSKRRWNSTTKPSNWTQTTWPTTATARPSISSSKTTRTVSDSARKPSKSAEITDRTSRLSPSIWSIALTSDCPLVITFGVCFRAYSRMANAYHKMDDLANAKIYFQKSLAEHRTPEILSKLSEVTYFEFYSLFWTNFKFWSKGWKSAEREGKALISEPRKGVGREDFRQWVLY